MNDKNLYSRSPFTLTILITLGLLLLTVFIGLFVLLGGLVKLFASAPAKPEPIPASWLLVVILVLLVIVAVLLLLLLICCCRGRGKEIPPALNKLLALLPLLTRIPEAIRKTAIALERSSVAIGWIHDRAKAAGDLLQPLGNAFQGNLWVGDANNPDRNLPIPNFQTREFTLPNGDKFNAVTGLNMDNKVDLSRVRSALTGAGSSLQSQVIPANAAPADVIGTVPTDLATIKADLHDAAKVLAEIATALGAPP